MTRVRYENPRGKDAHHPDEIDGVKYTLDPKGGGCVSDEMDDAKADRLVTIKGFTRVESRGAKKPPVATPAPTGAPQQQQTPPAATPEPTAPPAGTPSADGSGAPPAGGEGAGPGETVF